MLKRLFKDSFIYSLSNLLTRSISILLVPLYTRYFTPSEYGIIDILVILASIIKIVIPLEITQAVGRFFSDSENETDRKKIVSTAFLFTLIMYSLFLILTTTFSSPLSMILLDSEGLEHVFVISMISTAIGGVFYFLQHQLRWQLKAKFNAYSSILFSLLSVSSTLYFIMGLSLGIIGVFYGLIIGYTIAGLLAFYYAKEEFGFYFNAKNLKLLLAFSLPLVPSSIGVFISMYIDRVAIKSILTLHDVGIYALGYKVASIISILLIGFQSALTPLIYKNYQNEETPREIANIFSYFSLIALSILLAISLFKGEIVLIFSTAEYYAATSVVTLLSLSIIFAKMFIFTPGLIINKKTKVISLINIVSAISNILLNILLIPFMGIKGAALATLISSVLLFLLYLYNGQKYYKIPYEWKKVLGAFFAVIIIIFITNILNNHIVLNFLIKLMLLVTCIILMMVLFIGKMNFRKFISYIKISKNK
jgi:O-antigen/teichoic acid export membrane protein